MTNEALAKRLIKMRDEIDAILASFQPKIPAKKVGIELDFEAIYRQYPRKMGKSQGIQRLKTKVRTQKKYNQLIEAVTNYAQYHREERTENQFIKHFSSWISEWEDWISPRKSPQAMEREQKEALKAFEVERQRTEMDRLRREAREKRSAIPSDITRMLRGGTQSECSVYEGEG